MLKVFWRNHTSSGDFVRVWRASWPGDAFRIMHREDFEALQEVTRGAIEIEEADDD